MFGPDPPFGRSNPTPIEAKVQSQTATGQRRAQVLGADWVTQLDDPVVLCIFLGGLLERRVWTCHSSCLGPWSKRKSRPMTSAVGSAMRNSNEKLSCLLKGLACR